MATVHTVPIGDLIAHAAPPDPQQRTGGRWLAVEELSGDDPGDCPCGPTTEPVVDTYTGAVGWLITHHSLDGREQAEQEVDVMDSDTTPHCDQAVLHAPGACRYCDEYPAWQLYRRLAGIAFTGSVPTPDEVPCPSDARRGRGGAHAWAGNRPTDGEPGPPAPGASAGFGPAGTEPQRTFPGPGLRSLLPRWLRRRS